jgi:hypothetical protein
MIKDKVGQEIRAGQKAVWTSYNHLHMGTVKRVTEHRVYMEAITERGVSTWCHMPWPHKVMIVPELPKQIMFWAMKG